MNTPKELINYYKFCVMRMEQYVQAKTLPPPEVEAEMIVMDNCVRAWHQFEAKRNLEQRLDMIAEQWNKVTKPEQKAKLEEWFLKVQSDFVKEFYAGVI